MKDRKNIIILVMAILLLISGGLNFIQVRNAKQDQLNAILRNEQANTLIAGKNAEIAMHQATINEIRKDRSKDSLKATASQNALKSQIAKLRLKITQLPQQIVYNPDSATVDSLRVAFVLKDSVIDTQALMITSLEVEKEGMFYSFNKEIALLQEQREAQVDISNQLQSQLVESQTQTRREVRKKKIWRFVAGVGIATAGVLAITSQ